MQLPQFPTDSLYKFMAIGGVVIYGLSLFGPNRQVDKYRAQIRELETTRALVEHEGRVIERGVSQLQVEIGDSADRLRKYEPIVEAMTSHSKKTHAQLDDAETKVRALLQESQRGQGDNAKSPDSPTRTHSDSTQATGASWERLRREAEVALELAQRGLSEDRSAPAQIGEAIKGFRHESEDQLVALRRLQNFEDDHTRKLIELQRILAEVSDLYEEVQVSLTLAKAGIVVGSLLSVLGFGLWYYKIQRFQDAILRVQARGFDSRGSGHSRARLGGSRRYTVIRVGRR